VFAEQGQMQSAVAELQGALAIASKLKEDYRPHIIGQHEFTDWTLELAKALSAEGNDAQAVEHMRLAFDEETKWTSERKCRNILLYYTLRRSGHFVEAGRELAKAAARAPATPGPYG